MTGGARGSLINYSRVQENNGLEGQSHSYKYELGPDGAQVVVGFAIVGFYSSGL